MSKKKHKKHQKSKKQRKPPSPIPTKPRDEKPTSITQTDQSSEESVVRQGKRFTKENLDALFIHKAVPCRAQGMDMAEFESDVKNRTRAKWPLLKPEEFSELEPFIKHAAQLIYGAKQVVLIPEESVLGEGKFSFSRPQSDPDASEPSERG